jgi:fused signal recognition particle receptor
MTEQTAEPRRGWLGRLKAGLARSSSRLADGIGAILVKRKLDSATLAELEELLIAADLGPRTAARLTAKLGATRSGAEVDAEEVRRALADEIAAILAPVAVPLAVDRGKHPFVVLVVGVNGSGKTTTIGKLAKLLKDEGRSVMLCAGDTFRAAAIEQLQIWGARTGSPVFARPQGSDAAGVAYDALAAAREAGVDVLLVDTAGRLHNRNDLMAELVKVRRVLGKLDPTAPHATLLVLDASTGQNAHAQLEIFRAMIEVTGLVVTKLDGTARGGVLVALAERFGLPVHAIGIGEAAEDLRPFDARDLARGLLGL